MTLEEAIKHAEEVAATSCDGCREEHWQLAAWLKELQDIKEDSIVIPKTSTAWDAAQLIINTKCEFKTVYSKNMMNVFDCHMQKTTSEINSHFMILNNKEVNKISGQILQIELIKQTEIYGMYEYGTYLCEITEAGYQRLKEEQFCKSYTCD